TKKEGAVFFDEEKKTVVKPDFYLTKKVEPPKPENRSRALPPTQSQQKQVEYFVRDINAGKIEKLHLAEGEKFHSNTDFDLLAEDYVSKVWRRFWRLTRNLALLFLVFIILLVGAYLYFAYEREQRTQKISEKSQILNSLQGQIKDSAQSKKVLKELEKKIVSVKELQKNRILWTVFLDKLEHNITQDVYYLDLSADEKGTVIISARGKKYSDVAKQLEIFKNVDFVESVEINSVRMMEVVPNNADPLAEYPASFAINLKIKKEFLNK
ncbi:MAG: hypothetical protein WCT18_04470, partial [Patescibacteria group bacterium]